MVSLIWATVSLMTGILVYIAVPMLAMTLPIELRHKIGTFYLKLAARCLKQFTFVRRVLSGYDVMPIDVDDEQKLLKVTLSSSLVGDDNTYPFKDPDDRISRLYNKPVTVTYEKIPAALDAELAELGYHVGEKQTNDGLWSGDMADPDSVRADPYVEVDDDLRLVDPVDAYNVVPNAVDPENVKTTEKKTKDRFSKYNTGPGAAEIMTSVMGFSVGFGALLLAEYVTQNIIDGGGGGGDPNVPSSPLGMIQITLDMVVTLV